MAGEVHLQLLEENADAERVETLTGFLRQELLQLDVADVRALRAGEPPPGARGFDILVAGGLLVSLSSSAKALGDVISTVRQWLTRGGGTRRTVRLEFDGDVLELSDASVAEQDRLIELFVSRHAAGNSDR